MSEAPRSRVGNIIANRFRLDRWLGGSGDSAVYEAQDVVTHRRLALKLLDASAPDRARRRMAREALAIARLTHRHIVRVESVGVEADGSVFLVQDLLEGPTLAEILATRGFLSIQEALEIFEPLLDALAHAHDHGIVHRDVKPSNIVLAGSDADGTIPTLIDFGIADKLDRSDERRDTADAILGTPPYMAPEQAFEPAQVDARADVWGVAMTLHEAIAGTLPINATSFAGFPGRGARARLQDRADPAERSRGGTSGHHARAARLEGRAHAQRASAGVGAERSTRRDTGQRETRDHRSTPARRRRPGAATRTPRATRRY
ncbi:MAG: serine/threonine protein kinase [Sandaracinaceae bacterium]|nr:serine/threonine protein kinase [Sandaracinaceae bacterium]